MISALKSLREAASRTVRGCLQLTCQGLLLTFEGACFIVVLNCVVLMEVAKLKRTEIWHSLDVCHEIMSSLEA